MAWEHTAVADTERPMLTGGYHDRHTTRPCLPEHSHGGVGAVAGGVDGQPPRLGDPVDHHRERQELHITVGRLSYEDMGYIAQWGLWSCHMVTVHLCNLVCGCVEVKGIRTSR